MTETRSDDEMLAELDALDDLEPGELLPCPFCGGCAAQVDLDDEADEENFGGSCITCKQCGASSAVHFDRKENLYSHWNERIVREVLSLPERKEGDSIQATQVAADAMHAELLKQVGELMSTDPEAGKIAHLAKLAANYEESRWQI